MSKKYRGRGHDYYLSAKAVSDTYSEYFFNEGPFSWQWDLALKCITLTYIDHTKNQSYFITFTHFTSIVVILHEASENKMFCKCKCKNKSFIYNTFQPIAAFF